MKGYLQPASATNTIPQGVERTRKKKKEEGGGGGGGGERKEWRNKRWKQGKEARSNKRKKEVVTMTEKIKTKEEERK